MMLFDVKSAFKNCRVPARLVVARTAAVMMLVPCCTQHTSAQTADSEEAVAVDFTRQIQPVLAKHCYSCHGPDQAEGGLRFSDGESALAEAESGEFAIVPGDVEASQLIHRITSDDEFERMPPEGDPISDDDIELLKAWIQSGAAWKQHWAFYPSKNAQPPEIAGEKTSTHPIDAFVISSLQAANLQPNPPADRATLIRRAHYDLIGLPPTADEVSAFVADQRPEAYTELIDRLLASEHYGERWGRHWLDLVRYAETNSFERDGVKPNAWKYRDYVIRSFNDDKPYNQFVREQLAGDELDEVTTETLTATGFYRLGIWDDEPADPLQAKYDELDDIITTMGQAFLGLTINCARCHDHKIDPIPQTDYYSLVAFLSDLTPYGTRGNKESFNQVDVSPPKLVATYAANDAQRADLEKQIHAIEQSGIAKMSAPDQRATEGPKRDRKAVLDEKLKSNLTADKWKELKSLQAELRQVVMQGQKLPAREMVLGVAKTQTEPQKTHVMFRGNPHSPAQEVTPSFPTIFGAPDPELKNTDSPSGRRRIFADWVASDDNMLTSRVMANRLWQFHFGRGIIRSSNNFGQLGTPPTHPELLDWLSKNLVSNGWRLKAMHRLIMTSQTYQMSSATNENAVLRDPANDLFWKFDPRRLSAEEVRDSILAVNRSLNTKAYGPSVYPTMSEEVLAGQSRPGAGWGNSTPEERRRRSVYIHVKRSLLTPLLAAFDLPEPDRTCEARFATLQPGQALSMLNSSFIHEQAAKLAESIGASDLDNSQIVRRSIQSVLSRDASDAEVREGTELIVDLETNHGLERERAVQLYCLTVMNWNEFLFVD